MKSLSICVVCLQSYVLEDDEMYVPPNMKIYQTARKNPYIRNWSDWILHVQSHCPICRFECPSHVRESLQEHIDQLEAENEEIEREDETD